MNVFSRFPAVQGFWNLQCLKQLWVNYIKNQAMFARLFKMLVIKTREKDKDSSLNCGSLCCSVIPSRSTLYPSFLHKIQAMNGWWYLCWAIVMTWNEKCQLSRLKHSCLNKFQERALVCIMFASDNVSTSKQVIWTIHSKTMCSQVIQPSRHLGLLATLAY